MAARSAYDDPARIYEKQEARTCKGCVWEDERPQSKIKFCANSRPYGKRCHAYKERPCQTPAPSR